MILKKSRIKKKINLVIDASRIRSGGAIIYIKNFIKYLDNKEINAKKIVLFSYNSLLKRISNKPFLIKKNHFFLEKNILFQIFWQRFLLPIYLKKNKIDILFTTDSSSFCNFNSSIILNQDLLSFDKEYMKNIPFTFYKIRLFLIRYIQIKAMNNSKQIIFLSNYCKNIISNFIKKKNNSNVIYHGVDNKILKFKKKLKNLSWNFKKIKKIKLIYVSPLFDYKNHYIVAKSYEMLKKKYMNLDIKFVGSYDNNLKLFNNIINNFPSISKYDFVGQLNHEEVMRYVHKSDIFVFASSTEAFGITLLEGMALGMPIICSSKSSLPEILKDGGLYFNPKNHVMLSRQIEKFIHNIKLRKKMSIKSNNISLNYSWKKNLNLFYKVVNKLS